MYLNKLNNININKIQKNTEFTKNNLFYILDVFKELINKKKIFLTICTWAYPIYNGGGEMWLYDISKKMYDMGYNSIMITFKNINNVNFSKLNIIKEEKTTIIQMVYDEIDIIKLIKFLNPFCVHHQGLNRIEYMKLCNVLNIPFVSGFCFWQDILSFDENYLNMNLLENDKIKKSKKFLNVYNCSDYLYCASKFVNEVIMKYHNVNIDIIETISFNFKNVEKEKPKYITMININYYKGGWLLIDMLNKINIECSFLLIDSEPNDEKFNLELEKIILIRKQKFVNSNVVLMKKKIDDMEKIYKQTKILLIGSLVDETFCRVAYEGMVNKIPILSTNNGNLKYLLNGYADFLNENSDEWIDKITEIYGDEKYLNDMSNRETINFVNEEVIFNKFYENIKDIKLKKKHELKKKNVGIFIPWADQGLGIQGREYYIELIKKKYRVFVFSFKPYNSTSNNKLLQTNFNEWNFPNVIYYDVCRENVKLNHIVNFIHKTNISTIIIPEICFNHIFHVSTIFKLFGIKVIAIPNLEIIKYDEIFKYDIFDVVLCNNKSTTEILNKIKIPTKIDYLGFCLNHPFVKTKKLKNKSNIIEFYCCGGFNSFIRKHINHICDIFNELDDSLKLYVYIQEQDLKEKINNKYKNNIIFIFENQNYYNVMKMHRKHDIFIHMGSHEGLGLGFYEAIQSGTPVITMDTIPNNEIIKENVNGWLIKSKKYELIDNNKSIIYGDLFNKNNLKYTITNIYKEYDRNKMFNSIIENNEKLKNEDYINNLIKYL
jgi:glycosyltransferase involved in cell wall biosynthesis